MFDTVSHLNVIKGFILADGEKWPAQIHRLTLHLTGYYKEDTAEQAQCLTAEN